MNSEGIGRGGGEETYESVAFWFSGVLILNYNSFENFSELLEKPMHFLGLGLPSEASDEHFGPCRVAELRRKLGEISHRRRKLIMGITRLTQLTEILVLHELMKEIDQRKTAEGGKSIRWYGRDFIWKAARSSCRLLRGRHGRVVQRNLICRVFNWRIIII